MSSGDACPQDRLTSSQRAQERTLQLLKSPCTSTLDAAVDANARRNAADADTQGFAASAGQAGTTQRWRKVPTFHLQAVLLRRNVRHRQMVAHIEQLVGRVQLLAEERRRGLRVKRLRRAHHQRAVTPRVRRVRVLHLLLCAALLQCRVTSTWEAYHGANPGPDHWPHAIVQLLQYLVIRHLALQHISQSTLWTGQPPRHGQLCLNSNIKEADRTFSLRGQCSRDVKRSPGVPQGKADC